MGTITKLEIHFSKCGNYYKVRNPTSPNVGTIAKLEIHFSNVGTITKLESDFILNAS
ncbi:hypothetical protein LEP1GSC041_2574 [Leptospira noguchii str. 2006001870]|uniref:hypothetical protein n=1 Tax=Leptospira noguchii TaxID=28182 RepID=UPI000297772E|nr:hypothetical protein [Leptospira noguchii]EKR72230.1 hypothetical protein LEP1GSC041_2574 [Leptospira noguchii str. 2006001870]